MLLFWSWLEILQRVMFVTDFSIQLFLFFTWRDGKMLSIHIANIPRVCLFSTLMEKLPYCNGKRKRWVLVSCFGKANFSPDRRVLLQHHTTPVFLFVKKQFLNLSPVLLIDSRWVQNKIYVIISIAPQWTRYLYLLKENAFFFKESFSPIQLKIQIQLIAKSRSTKNNRTFTKRQKVVFTKQFHYYTIWYLE